MINLNGGVQERRSVLSGIEYPTHLAQKRGQSSTISYPPSSPCKSICLLSVTTPYYCTTRLLTTVLLTLLLTTNTNSPTTTPLMIRLFLSIRSSIDFPPPLAMLARAVFHSNSLSNRKSLSRAKTLPPCPHPIPSHQIRIAALPVSPNEPNRNC